MILVGLGSNLHTLDYGSPRATLAAALASLSTVSIDLIDRSSWYESEPVPRSDQPWFVNAVARVETALAPEALLAALHAIEQRFGRVRGGRNAARTLDLDLLDYDRCVVESSTLCLPHPRLHQRRFVLEPLAEIAPEWRHPLLDATAAELLARLPGGQPVRRIPLA